MSSVTPLLPAALPDVNTARLPGVYETARRALADCTRIDECKTWADKAAALASYAKQAKDDSLCLMARRIQARAYRRMGELLKQIPSATGAHLKRDAAVPLSRTEAANDAGLSERQRKTALRVATVPADEFEAAGDGGRAPTVSELAAMGTKSQAPTPEDVKLGRAAQELLRGFAAFCGAHDPVQVALTMSDPDSCRGNVEAIDAWLDRFVTNLGE